MAVKASRPPGAPMVWRALYAAWAVALGSSLGAVFIGEVMGQAPCFLCWVQRSLMFPLAIVLAIACWRDDPGVWRYGLPLAGLGAAVAAFHGLQYLGLVPGPIVPCGAGPSCTGADMSIMGGLPIPLLSLGAFVSISILFLFIQRRSA